MLHNLIPCLFFSSSSFCFLSTDTVISFSLLFLLFPSSLRGRQKIAAASIWPICLSRHPRDSTPCYLTQYFSQ
ncbi:hypothetical protein GGI35DRAFT_443078 [Trichoderma velutinum]